MRALWNSFIILIRRLLCVLEQDTGSSKRFLMVRPAPYMAAFCHRQIRDRNKSDILICVSVRLYVISVEWIQSSDIFALIQSCWHWERKQCGTASCASPYESLTFMLGMTGGGSRQKHKCNFMPKWVQSHNVPSDLHKQQPQSLLSTHPGRSVYSQEITKRAWVHCDHVCATAGNRLASKLGPKGFSFTYICPSASLFLFEIFKSCCLFKS